MNYYGYNYTIDEHTGSMTIYTNDNKVIAEVSDCKGMSEQDLNILADEVLNDNGYIKGNYFTEE
jgi:hypothetical protein